jgi:N-acetylmuramoyl-L-alanine amidase
VILEYGVYGMKRNYANYSVIVILLCAAIIGTCTALSRTVSVFSAAQLRREQKRIVIDAGHGGMDGGATSCTGKPESEYNLEISLKLRDILHLLGYPTRMVRTSDTDVHTHGDTIAARKMSDLKERVRMVNEQENQLLVSIHQNLFTDPRYSGAQVFHAKDAESQHLAKLLQHKLVETLNPGSRRQEKEAEGIYLMTHIQRPGILVECGFLSNPQEEAKLSSPEYQKKICCVIAAALVQFLETE